jgi:hypothetical protein
MHWNSWGRLFRQVCDGQGEPRCLSLGSILELGSLDMTLEDMWVANVLLVMYAGLCCVKESVRMIFRTGL